MSSAFLREQKKQETNLGEIHPVAFHSRTFSALELNYDTHDKELLAIFEAFRVWQHFLEGSSTPIDVVTDHKNLEYFSQPRSLPAIKPTGLSISPSSTLLSASTLESWAPNPIP